MLAINQTEHKLINAFTVLQQFKYFKKKWKN